MRFAYPEILYGLWIVILLGVFLFLALVRKQKILRRFAADHLLAEIARGFDLGREKKRIVCLLAILALATFALARPQWGFEWQEVKRQGLDILIAVDTSKSMLTQDVKPNRLERTKLAVKDLLKKLKGDRIGLIAFAGDAFLTCPLTVDYNGFLLSLEDIDTATIPRGGTNLSEAIREAVKEYDNIPSKYKAVIIVTDGENLEGDPVAWAQKAKAQGIKIYCVGIGTKEGELIQVPNGSGSFAFLKDDEGNFVKSRLNEKLLQDIALLTGGIYVRASGAQFGLDLIYERELSKLEKRDIVSKMERKYFERFQWPLAFALFLLIVETCLPSCSKRKER